MGRPKDKWAETVAALCGLAALAAYFGLKDGTLAILALIAGLVALAWSYLDVRK